ncbi:MAG: response regulator [Candidatus Omnitrophica bacterium]|nr:response regulator [Candidatus Omnitrophota bacterium]
MNQPSQSKFTQPLKILIVEDNQIDRRILESMLQESSTPVSLLKTADTLAGAMELLGQHSFDAVILDLNLPDSEGKNTLTKLIGKYPQVAIVINTGAYEDEVGIHTLSYGAQDFLVKGKYTGYVLNKALHYALERKRLERELNAAYERLTETQSQLVQMEKMKVVGALASGIAHEVKNPLSAILYGVTYLCEQIKSPEQKIQVTLTNMKEAIARANNTVNDLLNFAGTTSQNSKPENLNELVEKCLSLVHHEIDKKHVKVVKKFDGGLPEVNVDRNRIEQVLVNLIFNAIQAVADGGQLELKTYCRRISEDLDSLPDLGKDKFKPGEMIVVCDVEDNGSGIQPQHIPKVFDPFFTTRREAGGVGLGLSVTKDIMENHNGVVLVENRPTQGVRARLVFHASDGAALSDQ